LKPRGLGKRLLDKPDALRGGTIDAMIGGLAEQLLQPWAVQLHDCLGHAEGH
jgi:hypothetical protein